MWKRLGIGVLVACFCVLPANKAKAGQTELTVYNQSIDKRIQVSKGDQIVLKVNDENTSSYECYVSDVRIAQTSGNEITVIGEGKGTVTILGYNEKNRLCFQSMITLEVTENTGTNNNTNSSVDTNINNGTNNNVNPDINNSTNTDVNTGSNDGMNNNVNSDINNSANNNINSDNVNNNLNNNGTNSSNKDEKVSISSTGIILEKNTTQQLEIFNTKGAVTWTSLNKNIATVSSKGVVKAKKDGTAIIIATVDGQKFGCAVNVVSASMKKVVDNAISIGKGTYDQTKRMEEGYYDCSSLVWRSYAPIGTTFGNKNWAPVSADIGKWCVENGTQISESLTKKEIQEKKLKVGDLLFTTGANNGRYLGINHVEIFLGYACETIDKEGNVTLTTMCPDRKNGYGIGSFVLRPKK